MLSTDDLDAAVTQESLFQNNQISQYWDSERTLGRLVSQTLKLTAPIAWDIYMLYYPTTRWKGEQMPIPDFWMHQLDERSDLFLDPNRLKTEVEKAIEVTAL